MKVSSEEATGGRFPKLALCGKYPLPSPLAVRGLVLPLERFRKCRKCNVTAPSFQIPFMLLLPLPYDDIAIAEVDVPSLVIGKDLFPDHGSNHRAVRSGDNRGGK